MNPAPWLLRVPEWGRVRMPPSNSASTATGQYRLDLSRSNVCVKNSTVALELAGGSFSVRIRQVTMP
jgi:hypothetical protein